MPLSPIGPECTAGSLPDVRLNGAPLCVSNGKEPPQYASCLMDRMSLGCCSM